MQYAVFLNLDGTLMIDGKISEINRKAIVKSRENGHLIFINTGRSYSFMPDAVFETVDFDGYVSWLGYQI